MSHYHQQVPPYYQQPLDTSGLSVASMVVGISGLMLVWIPLFGGLLGLIATVLGSVGYHETTKYDQPENKRGIGFAITGLATGILTIVAQAALFTVAAVSVS